MTQLLTPAEMAAHLKISDKTFRHTVRDNRVPYTLVGKRKRFNPVAVVAALTSFDDESRQVERQSVAKRRVGGISKFAEALGI